MASGMQIFKGFLAIKRRYLFGFLIEHCQCGTEVYAERHGTCNKLAAPDDSFARQSACTLPVKMSLPSTQLPRRHMLARRLKSERGMDEAANVYLTQSFTWFETSTEVRCLSI